MPVHKSPKKMMRRDLKAKMRNKSQVSALRTQKKKFEKAFIEGSASEETFRKTQSLMARAGRKGLIPKGRASRLIGQMMKKMQATPLQAA